MTPVLTSIVVVLCAALVVVRRRGQQQLRQLQADNQNLLASRDLLNRELAALEKYRQIGDAEAEAARVLGEAEERARQLLRAAETREREASESATELTNAAERRSGGLVADAERRAQDIREEAQRDVARLRAEATQTIKDAQDRADGIVRSAAAEAKRTVDAAAKRAEEIAGSAFDAMKNADRYEAIAKAMRNVIDGYGDAYVVPSHSILDDLASEYGFSEAGQELKNARDRTRRMIKNGKAATCEYVEANRRETAIRFVVDAFNGKTDSILSRVKETNAGTLVQEVLDAFTLVNSNGAAFRNARVLDAYLESRLSELRWAAVVQELKTRDREEQRRIKEQIREEERAQREFLRALKETAKEEETLRKALEKAQAQVDKATEAQREKYEMQLADLQDRLRAAEERTARAKSMAEQTRVGHVYVISNIGSFGEEVFKIGLTRRLDPEDRVRELGDASVPFSFDIHAMIYNEDAPTLERALHKHFLAAQVNKVNPRKEFFRIPLSTIRQELDGLGIQARWTVSAEAREYRETLAIERALRENNAKAQEWLADQERLVDRLPAGDEGPDDGGLAENSEP